MKNKIINIIMFSVMINLLLSSEAYSQEKIVYDFNLSENNILSVPVHAGGIIKYKNEFYWYGENRLQGRDAGVSMYKSSDLKHWVFTSIIMHNSDLTTERNFFLERPKIIFNKKNNKFIMWYHLEQTNSNYSLSSVGVATSSSPNGNYTPIKNFRINPKRYALNWRVRGEARSNQKNTADRNIGQMSRDITIFKDDDGQAYLVSTSENNATLLISRMSEDYESLTGEYIRVQPGRYNEAPILFKRGGRYFIFSSGTTGWDPSPTFLYASDKIFGNWTYLGKPIKTKSTFNKEKTFNSQASFYYFNKGKGYFVGDKWNKKDIKRSGMLIKEIHWNNNLPYITD